MLLFVAGYRRGSSGQDRPWVISCAGGASALLGALVVGTLPLRSSDLVTQLLIAGLPPALFSFAYGVVPAAWADDPPSLRRGRPLLYSIWSSCRELAGQALVGEWVGVRDHKMSNYIARLERVGMTQE
jgi:hypothetical protein